MSSHDEALRIHQKQVQAVLQAEQDLIALQKHKYESETGLPWNGPQPHHSFQPAPAAEPPVDYQHHPSPPLSHHQPQPPSHCDPRPPSPHPHSSSFQLHKLTFEFVEARNLPNTDIISAIDPYIILMAGSERHQTNAFKNAGTNPCFNGLQVHVPIQSLDIGHVDMELWDSNKFLPDDFLGRGTLDLNSTGLRRGEFCDIWIPLVGQNGSTPCGEVHIKVTPIQ